MRRCRILQITPGSSDVSADAKNVGKVDMKGVRLLVNQPTTLDLKVNLAGQTTTVEVRGEAPTVNTQDATIGNAFNTQQIMSLPFEGRNAVEILSLQPGVVFTNPTEGTGVDAGFDSRNGSVNGGRSDQTNVTIDGLDNNDPNNGNAFNGALRSTLDSIRNSVSQRLTQMPRLGALLEPRWCWSPRAAPIIGMAHCTRPTAATSAKRTIGSISNRR